MSPEILERLQNIPPEVLVRMPRATAEKYRAIPLEQRNGRLVVLMEDPDDLDAVDDLRRILAADVVAVGGDPDVIADAISQYYHAGGAAKGPAISLVTKELPEGAVDATVTEYVEALFVRAIQERASDIHIEPLKGECRVRFRIDGILYDVESPSENMAASIASAIKVMADLNIAERRLPQDGRITTQVSGKAIDLRVSVIPTAHGEGVVIRILDKDSVLLGMEQLGFPSDTQDVFQRMIGRSHGLVLVTGPTGSGKTTTLYAALNRLNRSEVKIITIEDPIEYEMRGVNQIQTLPKIGLTFAAGLRSVLRHDPDIILVGEVRDPETAEVAIQAALTGHLVFTTLHTESAAGAVGRLLEMGLESYLVASATIGILAQRLVRMVCSNCKESYRPEAGVISEVDQWMPASWRSDPRLTRGRGCPACKQIGFRGRMGIFELFPIEEEARSLITRKVTTGEIAAYARSRGHRALVEDGFLRVAEGLTTPEEVFRVCGQ